MNKSGPGHAGLPAISVLLRLRPWFVILVVTLLSGLLGEFYGGFVSNGDEFDYYRGFRSGASIGFISSFIEVFYIRMQRRTWIRKVAFLPGLLVRILVLTLIVRVCLIGNTILTNYLLGAPELFNPVFAEERRDTLFSVVAVIFFISLLQVFSLVGIKRFFNMVIGRYFKPVNEDRAFLFVDLVGSSKLATELGNVRFHQYLSEFFYHLDKAIVWTGGEVVSYVGDAVIVSWPLGKNKRKNARCLTAVAAMKQLIARQKDEFLAEYGQVPEFRCALHGGDVVVGECGDSRRQITFLGDVVNMTARIEEVCKRERQGFLMSSQMVERMDVSGSMLAEPFMHVFLKGATEPFELYRISFPEG